MHQGEQCLPLWDLLLIISVKGLQALQCKDYGEALAGAKVAAAGTAQPKERQPESFSLAPVLHLKQGVIMLGKGASI